MPAGRPTKYTPEIGQHLLDLMAQGFSITAAAGSLKISRETVYAWAKEKPEFSDALKSGRAARVYKLEQDLLSADAGPVVTSRIFALKNADAHEWREKQEVEHSGGITFKTVYEGKPDG